MHKWIIFLMSKYGYLGVFFLILMENIFPPIPSEVILLLGGFMTTYTGLNMGLMILFASFASLLGAIILYMVGFILNKDKLKKLVGGRVGKILHFKESDIDASCKSFDRKGSKSVFISRFIPIVRSLISIPAGVCKMNFGKFLILTFLGSLGWNTILIYLGSIFGSNYPVILFYLSKYKKIVIVIIVLYFVVWFYKRKVKKIS